MAEQYESGTQTKAPPPSSGRSRPKLDTRKFGPLVTLAMCGLIAGLLAAAAAFPVVGVTGLTAKAASDAFQALPSKLKSAPIPLTSMLYAADGSYITSFYEQNRVYVKLADVPPIMRNAIIATEDQRFFQHGAFDGPGVIRALLANQSAGKIQQGASTLTQQLVKNILRYTAENEKEDKAAVADTPARKVRELRYAIALEKQLKKEEILERYLNIAYFGNGAYGVYAAAQTYFSKEPKDLTLGEASLIAGTIKNPTLYNPLNEENTKAKERRDYVLDRMGSLNYATQTDVNAAKADAIKLNPKTMPRQCENAQNRESFGFYCGWFVEWFKQNKAFGKTRQERETQLQRGGYHITLALDPRIQEAARKSIDNQVSPNNPQALGEVVVEPNTGRVKAMAINRTYSIAPNPGGRKYPNSTIALLSGTSASAGYQAGSTFKMFTMVAALEKGIPLSIRIHAPYQYVSKYIDSPGPATCLQGGIPHYCPNNENHFMTGTHTMWSGFGESVNTFFVQLEEDVGVKAAVDAAEKLGVTFRADEDLRNKAHPENWGSFTLGTPQVSPLDMANSYATLAARGKRCEPTPLLKITDSAGKELPYAQSTCSQVIPPEVADAANDAAKCPVGGTATGKCVNSQSGVTARDITGALKRQVAGKTGTTDNEKSAWCIGYTPNMAAAVFQANPDEPNTSVGHTRSPQEVFKSTMPVALQGLPNENFTPPEASLVQGESETVPRVVGSELESAKATIVRAGFTANVSPDRVASDAPEGRVARTDPDGGESAPKGSPITIYLSNGEQSAPTQAAPSDSVQPGEPDIPNFPNDAGGPQISHPPGRQGRGHHGPRFGPGN